MSHMHLIHTDEAVRMNCLLIRKCLFFQIMWKLSIHLHLFLISISLIHCQQLQWILLKAENSGDSPPPRRDAALGFDTTFLVLYGGRDQSGMPRDDAYAFNILQG